MNDEGSLHVDRVGEGECGQGGFSFCDWCRVFSIISWEESPADVRLSGWKNVDQEGDSCCSVIRGASCALECPVNRDEAIMFFMLGVVCTGVCDVGIGSRRRWNVVDPMGSPVKREGWEWACCGLFTCGMMDVGDRSAFEV